MIDMISPLLSAMGNVSMIVAAIYIVKLEFRFQRLEVHTGLRKVKDIGTP